mmetsp:Transcript_118986/g.330611  ORF Transcript_118986/g.330611 Transcript_118986/m.330611 type:complete len:85 (-) Transcript_118986:1300-1554(-)
MSGDRPAAVASRGRSRRRGCRRRSAWPTRRPLTFYFKQHIAICQQVLIYERYFQALLVIFTVAAKCLISLKKLVRNLDRRVGRA